MDLFSRYEDIQRSFYQLFIFYETFFVIFILFLSNPTDDSLYCPNI